MSRSDSGSRGFGLLFIATIIGIAVFYVFLILVRAFFDISIPIL